MLDKFTENFKFFIMVIIYTGTMAWWASNLNTTVANNSAHIEEVLAEVKHHNEVCERLSNFEIRTQFRYENVIYRLEALELKNGTE